MLLTFPATAGRRLLSESPGRRRLAFACLTIAVLGLAIALAFLRSQRTRSLETIAYGGTGPPTLVLLHGYGATAEQWVPFTRTILLPPGGRFVFPQAPEAMYPMAGLAFGRGWWPLDLASHIPPGQSTPDISATRPEGIKSAASLVRDLLRSLSSAPGGPILLGGFSQGAMVSAEVAFLSDEPMSNLTGLILLSGTIVDEQTWERHFARRRGLPVFISHGRRDTILPFEVADRLRTKLTAAGLNVAWVPFDGGHEMPAEVVVRLNKFISDCVRGNREQVAP
jgi:phospholipase/carboxylesterase